MIDRILARITVRLLTYFFVRCPRDWGVEAGCAGCEVEHLCNILETL